MSIGEELVLCYGTVTGRSFDELCAAAVAGGFEGVTLWPDPVRRARAEGRSWRDLRAQLADSGLVLRDLDPLLDWVPGETLPPGEWGHEDEFYEIAEALGARSLNLAQGFGGEIDRDAAAEALAGVCDRAAEHGLIVTLEYLPWSGIPDAATALDLVLRSGRANATVLVDTWHTFRGPTDTEQLRALPPERVGSIQINDAPAESPLGLLAETTTARRLPGEGDAPLGEWLDVLSGCDAPVGVEVFSTALLELPAEEIGRRCAAAARALLPRNPPPPRASNP